MAAATSRPGREEGQVGHAAGDAGPRSTSVPSVSPIAARKSTGSRTLPIALLRQKRRCAVSRWARNERAAGDGTTSVHQRAAGEPQEDVLQRAAPHQGRHRPQPGASTAESAASPSAV
jgi:hypothetical protein